MTDYFSYTLDADAIRAISSIGLAHLGDAVYELLVRTYLCAHGKATGKGLHRATVELVRAPKQAELADTIFGELTDEEHDVFRRGRNANVHTIPHSADRAQYQKATALEALFALGARQARFALPARAGYRFFMLSHSCPQFKMRMAVDIWRMPMMFEPRVICSPL